MGILNTVRLFAIEIIDLVLLVLGHSTYFGVRIFLVKYFLASKQVQIDIILKSLRDHI